MTNIMKEIYEAAILGETYPHSQIDIYLEVLQADGGVLPACINAASIALIHAGIAMKDVVVAATSGLLFGKIVKDVSYSEEGANIPIVTITMLGKCSFVFQTVLTSHLPHVGCRPTAGNSVARVHRPRHARKPSARPKRSRPGGQRNLRRNARRHSHTHSQDVAVPAREIVYVKILSKRD